MTDLVSKDLAAFLLKDIDKFVELRRDFIAQARQSVDERADQMDLTPDENDRYRALELAPWPGRPSLLSVTK